MNPSIKSRSMCKIFDNSRGRFTEEVHADYKEDGIDKPWNDNPFPQFMFYDKTVGFQIGLDGYYYFLQQGINLTGKYKERTN